MDPDAIRKRIVNNAQKEKDRETNLKNTQEEKRQRLKKSEIEAFQQAKDNLSQILDGLPMKDGVKITLTDSALIIYKGDDFGGGSDTYKYFYNLTEEKLYLNHIIKFGVYVDDFGGSSYDFHNPSNNRSENKKAFSTLEELLTDFEKTIQQFVAV